MIEPTSNPRFLLGTLLGLLVGDPLERESVWQLVSYVSGDAAEEGYAEGYQQGWNDAHESFFETSSYGVEITD